jgi:hypothetical protein
MICVFFNIGCRLNKNSGAAIGDKPALVVFIDSSDASRSIIKDDTDGFFAQISALEMSIQMKNAAIAVDRNSAIKKFSNFLRTQVSNWTYSEKAEIYDIFAKVKEVCDKVNPRIFPGDIRLIKIKTNHYGNDVYYTRDHNIFIPENILPIEVPSRQLPVMLHEIFHLLSRYNPELKHDLYKLIGFRKADKPVKLNNQLQKILLTNPDGVSFQYLIELQTGTKSQLAVPLITSKLKTFNPSVPSFFDYLNFDLYELKDMGKYYEAQTDVKGSTTIQLNNTPAFFSKIKDNTQYIIHPDEIIADNFMLALLAYDSNDYSKFSKEGRVLIEKIIERLQQL